MTDSPERSLPPMSSKMRVACATTSHDVEEGECPWCTIERLTRDIKRLTDDATRFCAEATTAENEVTRLMRELEELTERTQVQRESLLTDTRKLSAERDRLLTALKSIRDLRCSAAPIGRTQIMRAIASRALALPSEPNSAPETPKSSRDADHAAIKSPNAGVEQIYLSAQKASDEPG